MDAKTILAIVADLGGHKWLPLAVVVIGWLSSLTSDWSRFPVNIPDRWRPVVVIVLGQVYAGLSAVAGGTPWRQALLDGFIVSFTTMGLYDLVVKAAFGDKIPRWLSWLSFGTSAEHPKLASRATTPPAT